MHNLQCFTLIVGINPEKRWLLGVQRFYCEKILCVLGGTSLADNRCPGYNYVEAIDPHTLRVFALSLCFSSGRICRARLEQIDRRRTQRITSSHNRLLKEHTNRRNLSPGGYNWERMKQKHTVSCIPPTFGISPPTARLESRKRFLKCT